MTNKTGIDMEYLQYASNIFLTEEIPDSWFEMTEDEQDFFLGDHPIELLEYTPSSNLWDMIEGEARRLQDYVKHIKKQEIAMIENLTASCENMLAHFQDLMPPQDRKENKGST